MTGGESASVRRGEGYSVTETSKRVEYRGVRVRAMQAKGYAPLTSSANGVLCSEREPSRSDRRR